MKTIFISDLHGSDIWKKIVEKEDANFIFLGDYFDSFDISRNKQIQNFKELIDFGEANKDRVTFLLGNHDAHYILHGTQYYESMRGSGFGATLTFKVCKLYEEHKHLFKAAWQKDNILATHAGLRQDHYDNELKDIHERYPEYNYADLLNMLWEVRASSLMKVGRERGGWDKYGSIFWCGKMELMENPLNNITQIVGHTLTQEIENVEIHPACANIIFTDCLIYAKDKEISYYEIEI
jgi:predicted phosphodiesterase